VVVERERTTGSPRHLPEEVDDNGGRYFSHRKGKQAGLGQGKRGEVVAEKKRERQASGVELDGLLGCSGRLG
jgi:hypothetical protein